MALRIQKIYVKEPIRKKLYVDMTFYEKASSVANPLNFLFGVVLNETNFKKKSLMSASVETLLNIKDKRWTMKYSDASSISVNSLIEAELTRAGGLYSNIKSNVTIDSDNNKIKLYSLINAEKGADISSEVSIDGKYETYRFTNLSEYFDTKITDMNEIANDDIRDGIILKKEV